MGTKVLKIVGVAGLVLGIMLMLVGKAGAAKGVSATPLLGELETWLTVGGGGALMVSWAGNLIPSLMARFGVGGTVATDASVVMKTLLAHEANPSDPQLKRQFLLAVLQIIQDECANYPALAGMVNQLAKSVVNEWIPAAPVPADPKPAETKLAPVAAVAAK